MKDYAWNYREFILKCELEFKEYVKAHTAIAKSIKDTNHLKHQWQPYSPKRRFRKGK